MDLVRRLAPFLSIAGLGLAMVAPTAQVRGEFLLSLAITAALAGLAFVVRARWALLAGALVYLLAVALLRDATGGSGRSGVAPLVLLPVFAVALHGQRRQLAAVIGGVALVFVLPLIAVGGHAYPSANLRSGTLFVVVSTIIGFTVQGLVAELRGNAEERERLLTRLDELAHTDALSGLPNRRAWNLALAAELARAARAPRPVSVALLDLDHFKAVNDTHGHSAGDRLLRECAAAWRSRLRAGDVLARIGGDEFAVLLPDCPESEAIAIVERLNGGAQTRSAGLATWDGREDADQLMLRADRSLYAAKAAGRDRLHADAPVH
jgi:diguanylate cyclase (GGDEF)-like protein